MARFPRPGARSRLRTWSEWEWPVTPRSLRFETITTGRLLPNSGILRSSGIRKNGSVFFPVETSFPFVPRELSKGLRRARHSTEAGQFPFEMHSVIRASTHHNADTVQEQFSALRHQRIFGASRPIHACRGLVGRDGSAESKVPGRLTRFACPIPKKRCNQDRAVSVT